MASEGSRSDHITNLALSRVHQIRQEQHHTHRLPPSVIPDLRFEQTYLKKIKPHVHVARSEKGKGKEAEDDGEVITVEWGKVVWITTRDQIISPLVQGVLWGTASHFLRPLLGVVKEYVWPAYKPPPPGHEGKGAGWLRNWGRSLFGGVGLSTVGH